MQSCVLLNGVWRMIWGGWHFLYEDAGIEGDKVKLGSHQKEEPLELWFQGKSRMRESKRPEERKYITVLAQGKKCDFLGTMDLTTSVTSGCLGLWETVKAWKRLLWTYLVKGQLLLCLIMEVTHVGHLHQKKMPDRIWNEVLAGLELLDASFPTTSPSGDKVLRSVHQVHLMSSHEMHQRGESSLKSPCLLRAVLGPLLTCGCTCANLHWVNWLIQDRVEAEHDSFILMTYSGGTIHISPYPASVHVIPVWQGRACKAELPPPSAQLWEGRLLPLQQEVLWNLCGSSWNSCSKNK